MTEEKFVLNRMPVPAWSWLKVNETEATLPDTNCGNRVTIEVPEGVLLHRDKNYGIMDLHYFVSPELDRYIQTYSNNQTAIVIPPDFQGEEIQVHIHSEDANPVEDLIILAGSNSVSRVTIRLTSDLGAVSHTGRITAYVGTDAKLTVVYADLLEKDTTHNSHFAARVEDRGVLRLIQPEVGGSKISSDWNVLLAGEEAETEIDILYTGEKAKNLDFSTRVELIGKNTRAVVKAKGVLSGHSKKTFRDTLDFKSGAKGAKGREEEHVLMLSPDVRNVSVPLLFCGEDDVEGEHAASSGKPDKETMLYLMSRGLDEKEARILLAEAAFHEVLDRIQNEVLKEEILSQVRKSIAQGGE